MEMKELVQEMIEHREELQELGLFYWGTRFSMFAVGAFDRFVKAMGLSEEVKMKRRDDRSYPFEKCVEFGGVEFYDILRPEDAGCEKVGEREEVRTEKVVVGEPEYEDKEITVKVPIWKCKNGKEFDGKGEKVE